MGVVNIKSTFITNADATPLSLTSDFISKGRLNEAIGTAEVAAADSDGSTYRMVRIPSGARITTIEYANDAITAGTVFDIGVYKTNKDGGAAVSDALFATGIDMSSAHAFTDATYQTTATNIAVVEQRLWELLSLSVDPLIDYDIVFTGDTVGSAAGTLSLRVRYVI